MPEVFFKSDEVDEQDPKSRKIKGIMTTERKDRQGEKVVAKGLCFEQFLHNGHFNDNHSQETSKILGYPESVTFHKDLSSITNKPELKGVSGWSCTGYILKGTRRSDDIWELAQALEGVSEKSLGFSIEGKILRRKDKTIEKAIIRAVAITNCAVNTDCDWSLLQKSFTDEDIAMKSLSAGYGNTIGTQTDGAALKTESLDKEEKDVKEKSAYQKKREDLEKSLQKVLGFDNMVDQMEFVLERRPDFTSEAAATFIDYLNKKMV